MKKIFLLFLIIVSIRGTGFCQKSDSLKDQLFAAAKSGDTALLVTLLNKGIDVDSRNRRNSTPLHIACLNGQLGAARILLDRGADIKAINQPQCLPICYAVKSGNTQLVSLLVSRGESYFTKASDSSTLVLWAANGGYVGMVNFLLHQGLSLYSTDKDGYNALHWASAGGNIPMIDWLIEKGIDPKGAPPEGVQPVVSAFYFNQQETVKHYLNKYLKSDEPVDQRGTTLLYLFAENGDTTMLKYSLQQNVNLNVPDHGRTTPLGGAALNGRLEAMQLLLDHGAKILPDSGAPPLTLAALWMPRSVKFLLEKGADPNVVNPDGKTPLHIACQSDSSESVRLLLHYKAHVNSRDNQGKTPLHYATASGNTENVRYLLNYQADVQATDRNGRTPLHLAAAQGYQDISVLLIDHGALVNVTDNMGKSPLAYATCFGNSSLCQLLTSKGAQPVPAVQPDILASPPKKGEAYIVYLLHSGYAVRTQNHLLIFDYFDRERKSDQPSLLNGRIIPEELTAMNVLVFVSHEHQDHYNPEIWDWKSRIRNIHYVLGFRPADTIRDYILMNGRETKEIDGVTITTLTANDSGTGFLVEADGIFLLHPGDHANRNRGLSGNYCPEINFIASQGKKIDILFQPISGCGFGDLVAVKEGVYYAVDKLHPAVLVPIHSLSCDVLMDFEKEYREKTTGATRLWYPAFTGDRLIYD